MTTDLGACAWHFTTETVTIMLMLRFIITKLKADLLTEVTNYHRNSEEGLNLTQRF